MLQNNSFNVYNKLEKDLNSVNGEISHLNKYIKSFGDDVIKTDFSSYYVSVVITVKASHFTKRQGDIVTINDDLLVPGDQMAIIDQRINGMGEEEFKDGINIAIFSKEALNGIDDVTNVDQVRILMK